MHRTIGLALALPLALAAGETTAITFFSFEGTVTAADAGNGFGLAVGDNIFVTGRFGETVPETGTLALSFDENTGKSFEFTVGSQTFTNADDEFFDAGFPIVAFEDGSPSQLDFAALPSLLSVEPAFEFIAGGAIFEGQDLEERQISGALDLSTYEREVQTPQRCRCLRACRSR